MILLHVLMKVYFTYFAVKLFNLIEYLLLLGGLVLYRILSGVANCALIIVYTLN
jgi:hypothetical protein